MQRSAFLKTVIDEQLRLLNPSLPPEPEQAVKDEIHYWMYLHLKGLESEALQHEQEGVAAK